MTSRSAQVAWGQGPPQAPAPFGAKYNEGGHCEGWALLPRTQTSPQPVNVHPVCTKVWVLGAGLRRARAAQLDPLGQEVGSGAEWPPRDNHLRLTPQQRGGGNSHSCFTAGNIAKPGLLFPQDETEWTPLGTDTCGALTRLQALSSRLWGPSQLPGACRAVPRPPVGSSHQ